jgi:hypothetical protein
LTTTTPTLDEAAAMNTISPVSDDGEHAVYSLIPKDTTTRVRSLTITVDDETALIARSVWSYRTGGSLTVDETYGTFGRFHLPNKIQISARFPSYGADGTVEFTNYREMTPPPTAE